MGMRVIRPSPPVGICGARKTVRGIMSITTLVRLPGIDQPGNKVSGWGEWVGQVGGVSGCARWVGRVGVASVWVR